MKILVISGSPKGEKSDCIKLTRAFLAGMDEPYETVHSILVHVNPCRGCFSCWTKTPGHCVQQDDMREILQKILDADLVIWSTPLYCYSVPSNLKAVIDRLLPLSTPAQYVDARGRTHHPARHGRYPRMLLIAGSGFPECEGNFDALVLQFRRLFGDDLPMILCVEAPLLNISEAAPVADPYLALAKQAGREFKANGCISEETQQKLDQPMFPPEQYRRMAGS